MSAAIAGPVADEEETVRLSDVERVKFWRWFINNNIQVTHSQDIIDQYFKESGVEVSAHAVNDINRKMRFIDWYNREYKK